MKNFKQDFSRKKRSKMTVKKSKTNGLRKPARILIVDDEPLTRLGLRKILARNRGIRVCGEAGDYQQALAAVAKASPDLVTLEILLNNSSGLDLIKQVRRRSPKVSLLVISSQDDVLYAERALRAGALGYVHKQASPADVAQAIRTVLRGQVYVSAPITAKLASKIAGRLNDTSTIMEILTDRELQIFGMFGEGIGPSEMGAQLNINKTTVETYRHRIKKKLRFATAAELRQEAIVWNRGQGAQSRWQKSVHLAR